MTSFDAQKTLKIKPDLSNVDCARWAFDSFNFSQLMLKHFQVEYFTRRIMNRKLHFAMPSNVLICMSEALSLFHRFITCRHPTALKPSELVIRIIDGVVSSRDKLWIENVEH